MRSKMQRQLISKTTQEERTNPVKSHQWKSIDKIQ